MKLGLGALAAGMIVVSSSSSLMVVALACRHHNARQQIVLVVDSMSAFSALFASWHALNRRHFDTQQQAVVDVF